MPTPTSSPVALQHEDLARAGFYTVLARLLLAPDAPLLQTLAAQPVDEAEGGDDALAQAWVGLVQACAATPPQAVAQAHADLFIAPGTPPLNPYASFYRSGVLMDEPLARLRQDLARRGLARRAASGEPEDHLGALCDAMAALIRRGDSPAAQARFFAAHLRGWPARCLDDIGAFPRAGFYRSVAAFGRCFLEGEQQDFGLDDIDAPGPGTPVARWPVEATP